MQNNSNFVETVKNKYEYLKELFWALPVLQRVFLSSIIGAIAGGSIIRFLNTYALYYHAIRQGFRVPVEGVEYINLAISMVSFGIIIVSITCTILLYFLFKQLAKVFNRLFNSNENKILWGQLFMISLSIVIVILISSYYGFEKIESEKYTTLSSINDSLIKIKSEHNQKISNYLKEKHTETPNNFLRFNDSLVIIYKYDGLYNVTDRLQINLEDNADYVDIYKKKKIAEIKFENEKSNYKIRIILLILFLLTYIPINYVITTKKRIKVFTLILTLVFTVIFLFSVFNQSVYKNFLRAIAYGGEIPIKIEYRKADDKQEVTEGVLLIRSRNSIILKNLSTNNKEEIPNERISKIIFL
ncbi:hypothetical protein [Kordia jejudonensis]|uniref:hypothetical protein n=1 Tax=Kordia jejudonensis TaxID=1348245 RepID=UPI000628FEDF|nr:hypothetical protein [Kordia jejudonensis]